MSLNSESLGALFEMSRDAVLGLKDHAILFANPAAMELLGAQTGMDAGEIVPAYILEDTSDRFMASAIVADKHADVSVVRRDDVCLLCWTLTPKDSGSVSNPGRISEAFSESLASIRLAFDAIVGGAGLNSNPRLRGYTAIVYRDYYRLQRLCRHLSAAGNIAGDALHFSPKALDLEMLCRTLCDTLGHFSSSMGITIRFTCSSDLCITIGDKDLLEDMLLGLITNSLGHIPEGGRIDIGLKRQGMRFIISADDNGTGIEPDDLPSIFGSTMPMENLLSAPGAGLGLGIVRGIAEKHGGALIMESRTGIGTSSRVSLPVVSPSPADAVLHQPTSDYGDGMDKFLTELSVVLDASFYSSNMFD